MSIKHVAALLACLTVTSLAGASAAAPTDPTPGPTVSPGSGPKVKLMTTLTAKNVAAVPGEKKTFEAVLTNKQGAGVWGKTISFFITGKNGSSVPGGSIHIGHALSDGAGKATLQYALPELAQANYTIKAVFAGDDATFGASDDANLLMVKGIVNVDFGDLSWGTYKNEPGSPYGTIGFSLRRTSDGKAIDRPVTITVNGHSWQLSGQVYHAIALPQNATTWTVKVQFDGDAVYAAGGGQKTYTKPNN
jgi:hypothetical protein